MLFLYGLGIVMEVQKKQTLIDMDPLPLLIQKRGRWEPSVFVMRRMYEAVLLTLMI